MALLQLVSPSEAETATPLDPRAFEDRLEQVLAVLYNARTGDGDSWRTAAFISIVLRDEFGIAIHWRTLHAMLNEHRGTCVARRKRGGRWEFQLLDAGEKRVVGEGERTTFVDPTNALKATVDLHDLLTGLKGKTIRVCDPYLDPTTIEHLDSCPKGSEIRVLTQTVRASGKLTRLMAAAKKDFAAFEVRTPAVQDLHDRYILDDETMYILGTSLNGFGKKQSFITKAGPDMRAAMVKDFDRRWGGGSTVS